MRDLINAPLIRADALTKFIAMVRDNVGLSLEPNKEYLLDSRLSPIAKKNGFKDYAAFIEALIDLPLSPLHWDAFESLLTNETMFFRDEHFFSGLKDVVIPALIQKNKSHKSLAIWCTAVSSGQEAYSLAMLIKEYFPELQDWNIHIQASDICKNMLAKAQSGTYNALEIHRGLAEPLIQKYFVENEDGLFVIHDDLKKKIQFFNVNLIGDLYQVPKFDLILIRNVLIYFLPDTKKNVLYQIRSKLKDDQSYLVLGAAESLIHDVTFKHHRHGKFSFFTKNEL